jgi:PAS domain S-box-containing protein
LRLKTYGDYYDKYSQKLEAEVSARTADLTLRAQTLEQQSAVLTEQATLLDLARDAIVVRDMDNRIMFWSRGAEVMYGWQSHEVVGQSALDLLRSESAEVTDGYHAELLRQGWWEGEVTHRKRDGTPIVVSSRRSLQLDGTGRPVRILAINTDVTARKLAASQLGLVTERLSLAAAVAKVGVWEFDIALGTLTWDATMCELYGVPSADRVSYHTWSEKVSPDDLPTVEATHRRAIREGGQASLEYRIIGAHGSERYIASVSRVMLDGSGQATRMIGVNVDITERKLAEQALEESRQSEMRLKDQFLSHVSHELRSPLTAIKQFTMILLGGLAGELSTEQREYQEIILKNTGQLQAMIDDLLEITRLGTGKLTVDPGAVCLWDAVVDTLNTVQGTARAKGVSLSCVVPPNLTSAYADHIRLRQILIILLDNAIKFTPAGGAVDIRARLLEEDPRFLLLEVADTGCGIAREMVPRIFDRLYQVPALKHAGRKGLGLGLYICKELVSRQGGHIWVERPPNGGTVFSITLPVFSLNTVLAPLLKKGRWPAESVALVTVEMALPDEWLPKSSQEAWSQEVRHLLGRCLLPNLDVLLPNTRFGAASFFVAAFADERGASVLSARIREQLEGLPGPKQTGLTFSVSYRMLQCVADDADMSTDQIVTRMATTLGEAIEFNVRSEAVLP